MIDLSIRRPTLVVVVFAVLTVLAATSFPQLNYELTPKFSAPVMTILTIFPGASPAEVENGLTRPVEEAVATLESIRSIRSASIENVSVVTVQLAMNANTDLQIQEAQRKLDAIAGQLPAGARRPAISKISSDDFPILNIGATARMAETAFITLMRERVLPALERLEGVGTVTLLGAQAREVQVNVRQGELEQHRVSILQILEAIRKGNLEFPTGRVQDERAQVGLRLAGKFRSLDELRELTVAVTPAGVPVRLREVAEVIDTRQPVQDLSRVDGQAAVGLSILKKSDANAVEVSRLVRRELEALQEQYAGEGLRFAVATDTSEFTVEAVRAVTQDLLLAVLLVALVMIAFLHSFRNSLIVMISIPASLVTTIIVMHALGYTFNVLTLLAMSLVIGILVDDSIVVLENIFRHREMGKTPWEAARDGAREIFVTALSITLVLVVVFIPLILSSGIVAIIMKQFAVVVTVSIGMSLLVSYTIAPAMAARLPERAIHRGPTPWSRLSAVFDRGLRRLADRYGELLAWSLDHKLPVVALTLALLGGSALLVTEGYIGTAFLSPGDRGEFIIQLELPREAAIGQTNRAARQVEAYLARQPEVSGIFTLVGRHTGFLSGGRVSPHLAECTIKLVEKEKRAASTAVYAVQVRNALREQLPGVTVRANEVSFFGGANDTPIQIIVSGPGFAEVQAYAGRLLEVVKQTRGATEAGLSTGEGTPQLSIEVDRAALAAAGLDLQIVGATLAVAFNGNTDARYSEEGREYDIRLQLDAFDRRRAADVAEVTFLNLRGQQLKLSQFADIVPRTGPAVLERQDRLPAVTVQAQVLGRSTGEVGAELQAWIAANPPPAGVRIAYEGELGRQAESFATLAVAFVASIIFVYLIMVALYDSYRYPLVVMFSIPLSITGALLALALAAETLNVFSIVGVIMLNGLVAKNAILLVDFARQAQAEGMPAREALISAGRIRLRPILMTAISLVAGMFPIALASGAAAEWKNGLAWVIIGGLSSSTLLTLVVVPVVYMLVGKRA